MLNNTKKGVNRRRGPPSLFVRILLVSELALQVDRCTPSRMSAWCPPYKWRNIDKLNIKPCLNSPVCIIHIVIVFIDVNESFSMTTAACLPCSFLTTFLLVVVTTGIIIWWSCWKTIIFKRDLDLESIFSESQKWEITWLCLWVEIMLRDDLRFFVKLMVFNNCRYSKVREVLELLKILFGHLLHIACK